MMIAFNRIALSTTLILAVSTATVATLPAAHAKDGIGVKASVGTKTEAKTHAKADATIEPQYTDKELKAFAAALVEVSQIARAYQPKVSNADKPEDAKKLQLEAQQKMVMAVRNEGLTAKQYNEMQVDVKNDPALLTQVKSYLGQSAQ